MVSGMRRKLKKSEAVAKSEFYLNSTKEILNNTTATVLTWQLFLLGLNKSTVQMFEKYLMLSTFSDYWERKML